MKKIEQITINERNLCELTTNECVYGIEPSIFGKREYEIKPIRDCKIGDLLSGKIAVVMIIEED